MAQRAQRLVGAIVSGWEEVGARPSHGLTKGTPAEVVVAPLVIRRHHPQALRHARHSLPPDQELQQILDVQLGVFALHLPQRRRQSLMRRDALCCVVKLRLELLSGDVHALFPEAQLVQRLDQLGSDWSGDVVEVAEVQFEIKLQLATDDLRPHAALYEAREAISRRPALARGLTSCSGPTTYGQRLACGRGAELTHSQEMESHQRRRMCECTVDE